MAKEFSDISIEQLACLARDAGVSVKEELPEPVMRALYGRRESDQGNSTFDLSHHMPNALKQAINRLRF